MIFKLFPGLMYLEKCLNYLGYISRKMAWFISDDNTNLFPKVVKAYKVSQAILKFDSKL